MVAQLRSISGKNAWVAVDVMTSTRAGLLQAAERAHQIALVAAPGVAQRLETIVVHVREPVGSAARAGPVDLLLGELDQLVEVLGVALLQQVVGQHRDQRRRQRHRAAVGDVVGDQPLEHLQQGQVRPGDRLVQPLLLHHRRIFRVTDERQVGVQDEREISGRHGGLL